MIKFISGLLVGILATFIVLHTVPGISNAPLLSRDTLSKVEEQESVDINSQTVASTNARTGSNQKQTGVVNNNDDVNQAALATEPATLPTPGSGKLATTSLPEPINTEPQSNPQAAKELTKTKANENTKTSALIENPITLTDAHQLAIAKSREQEQPQITLHGQHDRIESESRDEVWSYYVEEQLKAYFGQFAGSAGIDIVAVDCRSTMCEIQAFTYAASGEQTWQQAMVGMRDQPWAREFSGSNMYSSDDQGTIVMFCFLMRKVQSE